MRALLLAALAVPAIAGGTPCAEAYVDLHLRENGFVGYPSMEGPRRHLHPARAVLYDDDDEVRPARRERLDGRRRQRRRHVNVRPPRAASHRRAMRRSAYATTRGPVRAGARFLTGVASYYGARFHGRRTASGARFNANAMTAAHRSLPFGTRVRVTHLGNGRSVTVRINDRGPFIRGRIIDLSRGAAGVLRMHDQGVARVKVTVLGR